MQAEGLDKQLEQSHVAIVYRGFVNIAESKREEKKKKKHPRNESVSFQRLHVIFNAKFPKADS